MKKSSVRFDTLKFFFHSNKRQVSILVVMSLVVGLLESASVAVVYPLLNVAFTGGVVRDNFLLTAFSRMAELIPITDTFISYCLLFIILAGLSFLFRLLFIRYRVRFSGTLVQTAQQDITP